MRWIYTILITMLLLGACSNVDDNTVAELDVENGETTSEVVDAPEEEPKVSEKTLGQKPVPPEPEVETAPEPVNTPDVVEALAKFDEKIKSYAFYYAPPPDNLARDKYYVKGNRVRIDIYEHNVREPGAYFDTVYLNRATKKATGYCLNAGPQLCDSWEQGKEMDFEKFNIKFPEEYLGEIKGATMEDSETLYDRRTNKLRYTHGSQFHMIWIDEFSGVPMRVRLGEARGDPTYEFKDVEINSVFDEDLIPPN